MGLFKKSKRKFRSMLGIQRRYFGLNDLDRKLKEWVNYPNGTFIEAGANNGINQSNTFHFEKFCGWTGLLVEPVPHIADECRNNRPRSIVESFALGSPEQHGSEVSMTYCDLMTASSEGMLNGQRFDEHIEIGKRLQNINAYDFNAHCVTLSSLIDKHSLSEIDLLSLDVEGFELNVLAGLDLTRHAPRYILVESRNDRDIQEALASEYSKLAKLSNHDILFKRVR